MEHVESFSENVKISFDMDEENKNVLQKIKEPLLAWFEANKRTLPWRQNPNAYGVWVSEIMLQQTRVEAVKGYYKRFLDALPTISDLAEADEDELLKLWEGLGYYNRVRNMQKAAQTVLEKYDGVMPADYDELLTLSGIGSYTAGAIASIAYQIPAPAVDGNVLRVIMRILENDSDIMKQSVKRQVEGLLLEVMSKEHPGEYNQALMELGATVCVPNGAPKCEACPVAFVCRGFLNGTAENFPVKMPKKKRRIEEKTVFVIIDGDNTVLRKRDKNGLLAGLYELPNTEGTLDEEETLQWVKKEGFRALHIEELPEAKHIFSHVEWHMKAYLIKVYETQVGIVSKHEEKTDDTMIASQKTAQGNKNPFIVVERQKIRDEIAIPSAFSCFKEYIYR